jgi:3-oxoacyl-[acyl-carrier protein] reductase
MSALDGHTTLITGAGGGVGRGIALACARAGARVVLAVRRIETGEAVADEIAAAGGDAVAVTCDVARRDDVESAVQRAVDHFGALDSLVHNATSRRSPEPVALEDATPELWAEHSSVSLRGSYLCAQAAFPELCRSRGSLVLMTSPAGIEGSATLPLYAAVKAGQRGLAKSLAREWGPLGIRVNAICPQAATPAMVRAFETDPQLEARLRELTPLGRIGDAQNDVGEAAVLLLCDGARFITGQTWVVDGGRFLGL